MATFIVLVNWTDQGIRDFKQSPQRTDVVAKVAEKHGGSMQSLHWTVGPYDLVGVFEAPDEESAAAMMLEVGASGAVRTTILRAFDRAEMEGIIARTG